MAFPEKIFASVATFEVVIKTRDGVGPGGEREVQYAVFAVVIHGLAAVLDRTVVLTCRPVQERRLIASAFPSVAPQAAQANLISLSGAIGSTGETRSLSHVPHK